MDIRQLRYFVRVVELRSLSRASEALGIAQPALGTQVRKLEEELCTKLLCRHSRGVEPTAAGLLLQKQAIAILQQVEETRRSIRNLSGPQRDTVNVGVTPTTYPRLAASLVQGDLPHVEVTIREAMNAELFELIRFNRVDFGLVYLSGAMPANLCVEELAFESAVFVHGPLTCPDAGATITFAEVCRQRLAGPGPQHHLRAALEELAARRGHGISLAYEVDSLSIMLEMIEGNVACSVLPFGAVARHVDDGRLVARTIVDPVLPLTLALVRSPGRVLSKAETALRSHIVELAQAQPWHGASEAQVALASR